MNLKISQLQTYSGGEIRKSDIFAVVDLVNGETKKITLSDLREKIGSGIPVGGVAGQVLVKNSGANGDASWTTLSKASIGLSNVNNTSDMDKPVSTAVQAQLNLKAPLSMVSSKADRSYVDNELEGKQDLLPTPVEGRVLGFESGAYQWKEVPVSGSDLYIGPADQDNSWRIILTTEGIELQVRKSGIWQKRGAWSND